MKTLQQLAETFEDLAADGETLAYRIITGLDTPSKELQLKQLESAEILLMEAEVLRQEAARLREKWKFTYS